MKKRQIGILLLVLALLISFNAGVYLLITSRCVDHVDRQTKFNAIDVTAYLPFAEDSQVVELDDVSLQLTNDLPVLDGAAALLPVYSAFVQAVYPADACHYENGGFTPDSAMQYTNTLQAYQNVVDGTADVVFCAGASQAQLDYAAQQGVELKFVPIGVEAFVFLVNADNPVEGLTAQQIRDIYAGRITNWSQVGGPNRLINPTTRYEGSGSQSVMQKFMGQTPIVKHPLALFGGAIGFSFRYYVEGIAGSDTVKMLAVDGVYPSTENIRSGAYPIVTPLYAVYRADNKNENIPLLIEWILSEEGQQIINESGYVGFG